MDDESWDFFCNNSPRLVEKKRAKTPTKTSESRTSSDMPKIMLGQLKRPKISEVNKSSSRIVYRDQTPPKVILKCNSKLTIKPLADVKFMNKIDLSKKCTTPVKGLKRGPMSSKRLILVSKEKLDKSIKTKLLSNFNVK
jgi:hypothetical protein